MLFLLNKNLKRHVCVEHLKGCKTSTCWFTSFPTSSLTVAPKDFHLKPRQPVHLDFPTRFFHADAELAGGTGTLRIPVPTKLFHNEGSTV